ncbi:MAG: pyridoxamine 5'-phosphate oxidase family protein [Eubacteriales bacterium]
MRRSDRELTELDDILDVMRKCDVCRIALNDRDGFPYILPLNFGMTCENGQIELFFHSATEGYKLDLIKNDNRASFEMDCDHTLQYFEDKGYCTFAYESVIGKGHITILEGEEKVDALQKLMDHYHPEKHAYFNPAAIPRTTAYKLTVESVTGKRKKKK